MKKKVVITGAAGRIGSRLIPYLKEDYNLVLADKTIDSLKKWEEEAISVVSFDVLNKHQCLEICGGVDTVIHLAANPSPFSKYEEVKHINMDGTYNMMASAQEKGCNRFVFASSIHAVKGYPEDEQVKITSSVRPADLYGVSKIFGEALGNYFAYQKGMEVIAVRIGGFQSLDRLIEKGERPTADQKNSYLSERDMGQLFKRCVKTELPKPFQIVHGISNNQFKYLDLSDTKDVIGYAPVDDGFDF